MENMIGRLTNYFRASYPGIFISTVEESRAIGDIIEAAKAAGKGVLTWSICEGVRIVRPNPREMRDTELLTAAARVREKNTVYIMRDACEIPFDRDIESARAVRELLQWGPTEGSTIIFTGPVPRLHRTFEKMFTVIDYSLPGAAELQKIMTGILESAGMKYDGNGEDIIRALGGLSTAEAENALSLSLIESGKLDSGIIQREKIQSVKRSGLLEIIPPNPRGLDGIGGMALLKRWILERSGTFTKAAREYPLDGSKGVLLTGVPGTGKSEAAKCLAAALNRPIVKGDIGKCKGSLVGESGANLRALLQTADANAPCLLWLDEIEKAFSGVGGGGKLDSGVSDDMFGAFLTWSQERKSDVFVVMTANNIDALPAETFRIGRIDAVFFVDLPTAAERAEIFRIHLTARRRDIMAAAINADSACVKAAEGFTGAEIVGIISAAMFRAFNDGARELAEADLVTAAAGIVPLSVSQKNKVDTIREWGTKNAQPVSAEIPVGGSDWKSAAADIGTVKRAFNK